MDNRLELLLLVFLSLPCGSWRVLLSKAHPFLQVRVGDVEHLHVGVHRFLHHLLEGLLLLLGLLLKHLLLLLGLLHPLLGCLLEGLLLLFGLLGSVRTWGAEQLHVGVHQLLHHLLGILLLLLDLLGELLHLAKPFPSTFWCLQPSSGTICVHCSSFIARLDTFHVPAICIFYVPLTKGGHTCRVSLEAKMAQMLLFGTKLPSVTSLQAARTNPPPTAFRHGAIIQRVFSFGLLYRYLLFPAPLRQRVRP